MLPMLLPSHLFLHLLSFALDVASSCAFQDIRYGPRVPHPFLFFSFFRLTLYDARRVQPGIRKAEECLAVATCTSARVHSTPITIFPIFLHTFLLGFFTFLSLSLSLSIRVLLCVLSFPICCARYLLLLLLPFCGIILPWRFN